MFVRALIVIASVLALLSSSLAVSGQTQAASFHSLFATYQVAAGYDPAQVETAYDFGPLSARGIDGSGQTIAVVEVDKFSTADLQQFDTTFSLPAPTISQTYVGGKPFALGGSGETTLDLEWAHALAPGANLQVYYIKNDQSDKAGWKSLGKALKLAESNGATEISLSFGTCRPTTGYKATSQVLAQLETRGISVFVSSGDTGSRPGPVKDCGKHEGVAYPASDPSVVAVGGTSLQLGPTDTIDSEVAWSGSGGGKGSPLIHPTWQAIGELPHIKYRWVPDVAFLGDPRTGVAVFFKGTWHTAGGTSLGAPAWAAIWALVKDDAAQTGVVLPAAAPLVYRIAGSAAYATSFHDITAGNYGLYRAIAGWDPVTGWGTPDVANLAAAALVPASAK